MSLLKMTSRNHPLYNREANDEVDDRAIHPLDFAELADRYGPFTVDAAAAPHNARCERYWTREDDGLAQTWAGENVWCNPPYSDLKPWIRKAWAECDHAGSITMLLPANRCEQPWWQIMVEPFRDREDSPLRVEFLATRLRFLKPGQTAIGPNERPPFGCCVLNWLPGGDTRLARYRPDQVNGGLFG